MWRQEKPTFLCVQGRMGCLEVIVIPCSLIQTIPRYDALLFFSLLLKNAKGFLELSLVSSYISWMVIWLWPLYCTDSTVLTYFILCIKWQVRGLINWLWTSQVLEKCYTYYKKVFFNRNFTRFLRWFSHCEKGKCSCLQWSYCGYIKCKNFLQADKHKRTLKWSQLIYTVNTRDWIQRKTWRSQLSTPLQRERGGVGKTSPIGRAHLYLSAQISKTTKRKRDNMEKRERRVESWPYVWIDILWSMGWALASPCLSWLEPQAVADFNPHKMTVNLGLVLRISSVFMPIGIIPDRNSHSGSSLELNQRKLIVKKDIRSNIGHDISQISVENYSVFFSKKLDPA